MDLLYNPQEVEKKWQEKWEQDGVFKAVEDCSKKKYYMLEMFPYPSGNIHIGHVRAYSIGDVIARYKRMCGYNVLHPMGWDAFGLPAENAAIADKTHPAKWTYRNIEHMRKQMKRLGFSYDWSRELTTCKSEYYKWEQWLFIKMLEKNMVYRKETFVNWCASCFTVLANEQVDAGMCWRCGNLVKQKKLWQWFFRITDYADDLLLYCDKLHGWPEKVITMQKNWIGKNFGVEIDFPVKGLDCKISVFTTRPDTIFGVTFISLSYEHPLITKLLAGSEFHDKVLDYIEEFASKYKLSKTNDITEKEGMFTGVYCINPVNKEIIPVYVVNFVLMGYGTGAIMSVPAHDQRDFDFAVKYGLPIRKVIVANSTCLDFSEKTDVFLDAGIMINSGNFSDLYSGEAVEKVTDYLEEKRFGRRSVIFRLKDWGVSRQRYWGTPIPIVYCEFCGIVPLREEDLPVVLPEEYDLLENGQSPLPSTKSFFMVSCPKCGNKNAKRETDTMDTFLESSWYFERFCSPKFEKSIFDKEAVNYWMPVDQYVGGIEHAVMHLLYSRYFTRVLNDLGLVKYREPFSKILTQGMVCKETLKCHQDGFVFPDDTIEVSNGVNCSKCGGKVTIGRIEKMSKSKKNVIDPGKLIEKYGADTLRLFCLFAAPPEKDLEWNVRGVEGASRFLKRVWRIALDWMGTIEKISSDSYHLEFLSNSFRELLSKTSETIKRITENLENRLHFNTAISLLMELINFMYTIDHSKSKDSDKSVMKFSLESVILLLYPMVPHFCEELWTQINSPDLLARRSWPQYDEKLIIRDQIVFVVQINGKLRKRMNVSKDMNEGSLKKLVLSDGALSKYFENKTISKIIFIKNRLINVVL